MSASNSLTTLVPVLDGTNYRRWAELMKAYLQQQGSWIMVDLLGDSITAPTLAEDGSNRAEMIEWAQQEAKAQGSIRLRLNVEVSRHVKDKATAKELWDELKTAYGSTSGMGAFSFFKAAIGIRIPQNEHPAAAISKIIGNLDELESTGIKIPTTLRALMILGAAPARYNAAVQATLNAYELKDMTTQNAHDALVASWESSKNSGQSSAQKISAIKQRKGNPSFSQQQHPSGSSSMGKKDGDDKGKGKATEGSFMPRGKHGGKNCGKLHRKHRHDEVAEMHIADTASLPGPSTSTVAEFGRSGSKSRSIGR